MRETFSVQKLLTFFQQKYWHISDKTFEILTKRLLGTALVLNNRAQISSFIRLNMLTFSCYTLASERVSLQKSRFSSNLKVDKSVINEKSGYL